MSRTAVQAIPTPYVRKDRTYASAESLQIWMREHGGIPKVINLITVGVHARRSRFLYQQVFGDNAHIGIIAVEDRNYDPTHWWQSSQGFRSVTDEMIAYSYARFFFYPPK